MPQTVLIHPETNVAQAVEPGHVEGHIKAGFLVPLNDPEGNPTTAKYEDAANMIQQGYTQPNPAQLQSLMDMAHYDTPAQQALTFVEGATKGLAPGLAPALEATLFPTSFKDIKKRSEIHPGTHLAGEMTGLIGGAALLPEASLPGLVGKMGAAAAKGIAAEGIFGAAAKGAVQGVIEGAAYGAANKLHEAIIGDPTEVAEGLLAHVGMSAAVGGGLGAALGAISKLSGSVAAKASKLIPEAPQALPPTSIARPSIFSGKDLPPSESLISSKATSVNAPTIFSGPNAATLISKPSIFTKGGSKAFAVPEVPAAAPVMNTLEQVAEKIGPEGMEKTGLSKMVSFLKWVPGMPHVPFGGKIAGKVLNTAMKMMPEEAPFMATLIKAKEMMIRTDKAIDRGAGALFNLATNPNTAGMTGYAVAKIADELSPNDTIPDGGEVTMLANNPEALMQHLSDSTIHISGHMPNVATALSASITNGVNYLNAKRPQTGKAAPLDSLRTPTQAESHDYQRNLAILDKPISILEHVKTGMIHPEQIEALTAVYPALVSKMQAATMDKLVTFLSKNSPSDIPYRTRLGLAQFLGQNLDSNMSQQAIAANQMALIAINAQKAPNSMMQATPSKTGMGKMSAAGDQTRFQQSQSRMGRGAK